MNAQQVIDKAETIEVASGEGEIGTVAEYTGKRTVRAIKSKLTRETCHGDRWAKLIIDGEEYDISGATK